MHSNFMLSPLLHFRIVAKISGLWCWWPSPKRPCGCHLPSRWWQYLCQCGMGGVDCQHFRSVSNVYSVWWHQESGVVQPYVLNSLVWRSWLVEEKAHKWCFIHFRHVLQGDSNFPEALRRAIWGGVSRRDPLQLPHERHLAVWQLTPGRYQVCGSSTV